MCLAVPAQVTRLEEHDVAVVELGGVRQEISTILLDHVEEGDYVLVHVGFAIHTLDQQEAQRTLELLEELARAQEGAG